MPCEYGMIIGRGQELCEGQGIKRSKKSREGVSLRAGYQ